MSQIVSTVLACCFGIGMIAGIGAFLWYFLYRKTNHKLIWTSVAGFGVFICGAVVIYVMFHS